MLIVIICCIIIFLLFIYTRLTCGINRSSVCLLGKTALITGANSGLGYQTALNLASRGCRVIMADVENMEESKSNIIKFTNNTNIIAKQLDLSSLKSVRKFADDILKTEEKLHILVNNAGIGASDINRTKDNLHPVMQINYFGHFLLTHLFIDLLQKSVPSRIIFTTSLMSIFNNLTIRNLNFDHTVYKNNLFQGYRVYANSKLAIIIASDIFAEKLKGTGITSNSVHPGLVRTNIFIKSYSVSQNIFYLLYTKFCHLFFAKDAWEGAQTLVYAAISKKVEGISGFLFSDCKSHWKPVLTKNKEFCENIWKASENYVGLQKHECI